MPQRLHARRVLSDASDSAGEDDRDDGDAAATGMLDAGAGAELHVAHQISSGRLRWNKSPHCAQSM